MANSGSNTNGSQFFLVYKDTTLNPNYTIWGKITKGLEILDAIAAVGTVDGGTDGKPKYTIEIRTARLK
jgi:peptidyl-prolyl cis-trans isomerase B (cyclophilin B)